MYVFYFSLIPEWIWAYYSIFEHIHTDTKILYKIIFYCFLQNILENFKKVRKGKVRTIWANTREVRNGEEMWVNVSINENLSKPLGHYELIASVSMSSLVSISFHGDCLLCHVFKWVMFVWFFLGGWVLTLWEDVNLWPVCLWRGVASILITVFILQFKKHTNIRLQSCYYTCIHVFLFGG